MFNRQHMEEKITFSLWTRVLIFLVLLVPLVQGHGQTQVFAAYESHDTGSKPLGGPVVGQPTAVNQRDDTYATLYASPGVALGGGSYGSYIQVKFPSDLEANTWSYVRLTGDTNLFSALLGGSLGQGLSNVLGAVLLGRQQIQIEAINSTNTTVLTRTSAQGFNLENVRLIEDPRGYYLLAIKPNAKYNRIKISTKSISAVGLGAVYEVKVYDAFTYQGNANTCGKPVGTSFDGKGISLSVLPLGDEKLSNAIDNNLDTYSSLKSTGLLDLSIAGFVSQYFYFPTRSTTSTSVNVKLATSTGAGILNLNLLSSIEIIAWKDDTTVYKMPLAGGILQGTNLLGLLERGDAVTITVAPGVTFDKLEIRLNSPVGLSLAGSSIKIYDVERFDGITCINPIITIPSATAVPFETASCVTSLVEVENTNFATNVLDNNNETYANLYASAGSILSSTPSHGMIHMSYPSVVPAYTTSYIRIDMEDEILSKLLGGTLGHFLNDVVGAILGNHYFEVDVYNETNPNPIAHASSNPSFTSPTGGKMTVVQDKIGRYYLAVTPNQAYKSIKITNKVSSIPNGEIRALKVYNMCHEIGTDLCFAPQFTSYDQTGLSLSIAGVTNPYYAISGNSSEFSEISTGTVAVAAKVSQAIYFGKPSQTGDQIKMRLQLNPTGLLALDLAGKYRVVTFLGDQQKEVFTLQQGLINNLNLLNLFKSGGIQTLTFDTTQTFDRVEVQVGSLVNASVVPAIRLYDVKRVSTTCPESSGVSPFTAPVCATELLDASNANDIGNLFDGDFDSYATLQSGAGFLLGLGNKFEGFVEMGYAASVPANTTSYVRIDFENTALEKLISGSLGNLVTGILNGLVFGNHDFEVQVKNEQGTVVLNRGTQTTNASSSEGTIRVVVDKLGRTYLAITPTSAYKSVRIIDKTNSALGLLAQPNSMNVYGMCYETAQATCVAPFATSYEYTGLNLSVNVLGGAGVTYPERAIDDNSTHGSQMSLGTISVAGGVKQWIYFNSLSEPDDITNIRMKVGTGGVTLALLENFEIIAYKGDTFVDRLDWNNGLLEGTEVLGLLNSATAVDIPFHPNGTYDRISIGIKNVVNVGVFPPVEIYKVERLCRPVGSNQNLVSWKSYQVNGDASVDTVVGGEVVQYTIHVKNVGNTTISQFTVSDKLPVGTTFLSAVGGRLSDDGEKVLFDFTGTLTPGSERQFVFSVDVQSDLVGILEIKNVAFTKENGSIISYPSYPPVDNTNPTEADLTKNPGTIIKVSYVTTLPKAIITSDQPNDLCVDTVFTLDSGVEPTDADTYQWYINGEPIEQGTFGPDNPNVNYGKEKTLISEFPGSYTVIYTKGTEVAALSDPFVVTQKESPVISFSGSQHISATVGQTIVLPTATSSLNGTIQWYDHLGNEFTDLSGSFDAPGIYTFTVVAISDQGCESFENIIITVYDTSLCPPTIERVYAGHSASWGSIITGGVVNSENTIDGNPQTYSTLTTGLGLLGIGTVWQNVNFDHIVPAGTPVTIKLGKQYSLLVLAGGISVQGLDENGGTIGSLKPVQGGLLDLLAADNVVEFTFVPSDKSGPKEFKGVRISQGSLLGLAQMAKVFSVHYTKNVSQFSAEYCQPVADGVHPSVLDVLHGVQDLGLGVASATASVVNPWNAVDNDPETYATIARGVAVLNAASLTVVFKQQAMPGDKLHIVTEIPGNPILSLELIKGYTVQRYLGEQKVGPELDGTNGAQLLSLKLLGLGYSNKYKIIVSEIDQPFDRVKISYGSVVGVLGDLTKIYEVSVAPKIDVGIDIEKEILAVCKGGIFTITPTDGCSTYEVFTEEIGGLPLTEISTNNYRLPNTLPEFQDELPDGAGLGPKYSVIYVQTYRNGCLVGRRLPIRLHMNNCSVKSNLNVTQKIK